MTVLNKRYADPIIMPAQRPTAAECIAWLRGMAKRNRTKPCAVGLTEFGIMALTAAELLEDLVKKMEAVTC